MDRAMAGKLGERYAARYLLKKGYTVLAGNYRTRMGEIDIVASKGDLLIFVEVKTRSPLSLYEPREAVNSEKQRKIVLSAIQVIKNRKLDGFIVRFDVIEVVMSQEAYDNEALAVINHIENAFGAEDYHAYI